MSNGSGSDSGSSSQTSSFDYESEAYSPSQSFDYESDAAGLTTTTDYGDSGAVDTGDLGSVAANVGSTEPVSYTHLTLPTIYSV